MYDVIVVGGGSAGGGSAGGAGSAGGGSAAGSGGSAGSASAGGGSVSGGSADAQPAASAAAGLRHALVAQSADGRLLAVAASAGGETALSLAPVALTPSVPAPTGHLRLIDSMFTVSAADSSGSSANAVLLTVTVVPSDAALAAVGGATAAAAKGAARIDTIHVVFIPGPYATFDFNHNGLGLGDRVVSRGPLTDPQSGQQVGTAYGDCVIFSPRVVGGVFRCSYLLDLPGGNLTAEGLDPQGISDVEFSVTGGTNDYMGAAGQAEFVDSATQTDIYVDLESPA